MMEDLFNDDLDVLEILDFGFPRRFNLRPDYFQVMDNLTFFKTFRLYKETVLYILDLIEHNLEYPDDRNNSVSPINQLLCCLRFFASSGHLRSVATFMNIDPSTASRIVKKVTEQIARLAPLHIKMPDPEHFITEQEKFYNMFRFPRIIGLIDGTHIRIQSVGGDDAEVYRHRKGFFSLNVQVVGNADLKIVDIVVRWPGLTHDSTIFANSRLGARFEVGEFPNCVLLGDSGYPLKEYLLIPLVHPNTRGEELYNHALVGTMNAIERIIGIWKRRFPVVAYGMRLQLETSMTVIVATAVLHNIARDMNETEPPLIEEINENHLNYLLETENINIPFYNENVPVNFTQRELINYFNNLE